jgi:hypothetical protein
MKYSTKAQRAIKNYGYDICREAFRMHDVEGEGGCTIGIYLNLKTRQADAAIDAGREIEASMRLTVRGYVEHVGNVVFVVSGDEWMSEVPVVRDGYCPPIRDYQIKAVIKKAAKLYQTKLVSFSF